MERYKRFMKMIRKIGKSRPSFPALTVSAEKGCILKCDLGVLLEHTGVYIGKGKIVSLNRHGIVRVENEKSFFPPGTDPDKSKIMVACAGETDKVLRSTKIAEAARKRIDEKTDYNLFFNNCHRFTTGCVTGNFQNEVVSFAQLESVILENMELLYPKRPWWKRIADFVLRREKQDLPKTFHWRAVKLD